METDLTITATDTWSTPTLVLKGFPVSISVKGLDSGNIIKVRRWLQSHGETAPDSKYIDTILSITEDCAKVDISGGNYFYDIGTDDTYSGSCEVHVQ